MIQRLRRGFFEQATLDVARELLGQRLVKLEGEARLSGFICETEAYIGTDDDGCHAKAGLTPRNRSMWGPAGHCYVYFTYGMHWMLNLVTERDGFPAAVLVRALFPVEGLGIIEQRRAGQPAKHWTDGPAKLCQAFGIHGAQDGLDVCLPDSVIFIEREDRVPDSSVTIGPRVGLNRVAEPWKGMPWRFRLPKDQYSGRGES
jgi:DNA-3-methyladenine glycosylase